MARKKGLGRGLGALIPSLNEETKIEKEEDVEITKSKKMNKNTEATSEITEENLKLSSDKVFLIDIDLIEANEDNPRKNFDIENLENLAESIKKYGVIQPIVLVEKGDKYSIVAGERRYRASKIAELEQIPAIIKSISIKEKDIISMIENIQREDLNPYEEAVAYKNIIDKYSMTQEELSKVIGKSRAYIANIIRLLQLDDNTITKLENGDITSSQGRALLTISDLEERKKYLDLLVKKEITVNEIENKSKLDKTVKKNNKHQKKDIFVTDLEERLMEVLGTKVTVIKVKDKWKVNLEFVNDEQIEDFLSRYDLGD